MHSVRKTTCTVYETVVTARAPCSTASTLHHREMRIATARVSHFNCPGEAHTNETICPGYMRVGFLDDIGAAKPSVEAG